MQEVYKKMKFKNAGIVLHAPEAIETEFLKMGFSNNFATASSNNTLIFVSNFEELVHSLRNDLATIEPDSVLWYAYPKGTSKLKSDIHRDIISSKVEEYGLSTVAAVSIDETWSALRLRPSHKVGSK